MTDTLTVVWTGVTDWLARHAPATHTTLNPPATAAAIAAAEREIGYPFPAELVTWWLANDGVRSGPVGMILPGYAPMPINDVLDVVDLLLSTDYEPPETPGEIDHGRAGEPTPGFLPQFVPVASDCSGAYLVLDLRPGPRHGCVLEYWAEMGFRPPQWPSLTALLRAVLDALTSGRSVKGSVPYVERGELSWRENTRRP